jgi:DNA repair protein RadC
MEKYQESIQIVSIQMVREKNLMVEYNEKINSPGTAVTIVKKFLQDKDREYLIVLSLDTKNKVNALSVVSIGSLNSSIVHPREVFKIAILSNAASIIISHNHPSGDTTPSTEDLNITKRLKECGKILGIDLIDHIIIGNEKYLSFKEEGIL